MDKLGDRMCCLILDNNKKYYISNPTADVIKEADWKRVAVYNKCFRESEIDEVCVRKAENTRWDYLTASVIEFENGSRVWGTYEDYILEPDKHLALMAKYQTLLFLQGFSSDFLGQNPDEEDILKLIGSCRVSVGK